jgi:hypothetical protein
MDVDGESRDAPNAESGAENGVYCPTLCIHPNKSAAAYFLFRVVQEGSFEQLL